MIIVDALQWWYGPGWVWFVHTIFVNRNKQLAQFFSFKDISKTLFAPFRQDSSTAKNAPLNIKLQAMGMNIVSRFFGFFIRVGLLTVGLITILFSSIFGLFTSLAWPLIPLSPLIGLLLFVFGVGTT